MAKTEWTPKTKLGKIWYFIWYDDSVLSWIVNIILAFIIIKFIVYPGLGWILGTPYPIVAVISGSMDHGLGDSGELCGATPLNYKENFDNWWDVCGEWYANRGMQKNNFKEYSFRNGFSRGDIIVLKGRPPGKIDLGNVIVFSAANRAYKTEPIIHRVVRKTYTNEYVFQTKGDHNPMSIENSAIQEMAITPDRIMGVAWFRIPWLGYIKIWFAEVISLFG